MSLPADILPIDIARRSLPLTSLSVAALTDKGAFVRRSDAELIEALARGEIPDEIIEEMRMVSFDSGIGREFQEGLRAALLDG